METLVWMRVDDNKVVQMEYKQRSHLRPSKSTVLTGEKSVDRGKEKNLRENKKVVDDGRKGVVVVVVVVLESSENAQAEHCHMKSVNDT